MSDKDIELYIMVNEPAFDIGEKQYSVCYANGAFGTCDSDGNTMDFDDIADLLDNWEVGGLPFRQIVPLIM